MAVFAPHIPSLVNSNTWWASRLATKMWSSCAKIPCADRREQGAGVRHWAGPSRRGEGWERARQTVAVVRREEVVETPT